MAQRAADLQVPRVIHNVRGAASPIRLAERVLVPAQANNAYVFPGVGFGLLVSGATRVTDGMFDAAAEALAGQTTDEELRQGRLFPAARRMRDVTRAVAIAVAGVAHSERVAAAAPPSDHAALAALVDREMYVPTYDRPLSALAVAGTSDGASTFGTVERHA